MKMKVRDLVISHLFCHRSNHGNIIYMYTTNVGSRTVPVYTNPDIFETAFFYIQTGFPFTRDQ